MHAAIVTCGGCGKQMAVLLEPQEAASRYPYVFACPWCSRLTSRSMTGVLMRVVRASADDGGNESDPD